MALDYLGQRIRRGRRARRFGLVFMVGGEFWQLQQDLWLAGRDHRLHDVDLDLDHRRSGRRQAQCGDGTSNRATAPPGNQSRSGDAAQEWPTRLGDRRPEKWIGGMLTISEAQRRTELFLIEQMLEALRAVEYELPSFDAELQDVALAAVARARFEIRHVRGASDATYLINAFGEELLMQLHSTFTGSLSFIACRHSMHSTPAPLPYVSNAGASVPSTPAGNLAGATRQLPAIRPVVLSKPIATPLSAPIFSKTSRSSSIGDRYRADDPLLHD